MAPRVPLCLRFPAAPLLQPLAALLLPLPVALLLPLPVALLLPPPAVLLLPLLAALRLAAAIAVHRAHLHNVRPLLLAPVPTREAARLAAPRPAHIVAALAALRPVVVPAAVAAPAVDSNAARLTFDRLLFFKTFHRSLLFSKGFRKGAFCCLSSSVR